MTFQAKLVDPNGKPKAVVATHDRVASGKEFQLFQHMLGIMALGCVPDAEGRFDAAGHQMTRVLSPDEIVYRAEALVRKAMWIAEDNGWVVTAPDIDQLYDDHDSVDSQRVGFGTHKSTSIMDEIAKVSQDDDIPF